MEPLTHFLTGACIGRAGLNRKTAYATVVATIAAEAADLDMLWFLDGPVVELKHHRGITHTLLGAPFVAAAVVGCVALWRLYRRRRSGGKVTERPGLPPVRWGWLYATGLIAALSHILLDWTNNYGVRPFFPFNSRWYAGSIVFIAEPVLWGLLLTAMILPWLFGLTDREIGARRSTFRGQYLAIFALSGMVVVWCWRWSERAEALELVQNNPVTPVAVIRSTAEPYATNPWHWHVILETEHYYQTAEVNTHDGSIETDARSDVIYKPTETPAVEAAKRTFLGRVYLDWGKWALVRDLGQDPAPGMDPPNVAPPRKWSTVEFTDLRYAYAYHRGGSRRPPPGLSGWVYILENGEDAGESMGGHPQK